MQAKIEPITNRNTMLHYLLEKASGVAPTWTTDARANLFGWLHLENPSKLRAVAEALAGKVRLCTITAYAEARDDTDKKRRIAYHFATGDTVVTVTVIIYDQETMQKLSVPSITPWFRNADWNEREFREMYNIDIDGHPNPKRLFLDERLDAGIMAKLIPFSAMANSAGTNTMWERILEAKGVAPEERMPSVTTPAEPIKVEPVFTPVTPLPEPGASLATPTLAVLAKSAEEATGAVKPARNGNVEKPAAAPAKEGSGATAGIAAGASAANGVSGTKKVAVKLEQEGAASAPASGDRPESVDSQ